MPSARGAARHRRRIIDGRRIQQWHLTHASYIAMPAEYCLPVAASMAIRMFGAHGVSMTEIIARRLIAAADSGHAMMKCPHTSSQRQLIKI